jgi:hypothetical protein
MGTGYTRNDTANNIADGNVINASDLDGEFDAIQAAFNASNGHSHDGSSGEGPNINTAGLADDAVTAAKLDDTDSFTMAGLTVSGAVALNGNTTIGNADTDTVTVTADFGSSLIPSADATHDLGASGSEWNDLYITGTANIDALVADTADINAGSIDGVTIGTNSVVTDLRVDNLKVDGNTISSTDTAGNITLAPDTTGDIHLDADTIRVGDSGVDATLTTNGAGDIIINTNAGSSSGTIRIYDGADGNINLTPNGTGSVVISKADINGGAIDATNIGASTAGTGNFSTLSIGGTAVTATATEINGLAGLTADSTELNLLDGATVTTAEINYNDVTTLGTVEASKTVTADASGNIDFNNGNMTNVDIDSGAIDGTAIGAASASTGAFTTLTASTSIGIGGTTITASAAELNILDGVTATAAELNYNDITTLGTSEASKAITADANNDTIVSGAVRGTVTTDDDVSFDLSTTNNFKCTPAAGTHTLTFTGLAGTSGQSGNIWLDNGAGATIQAATTTYISGTDLTTISAVGEYFLSYFSDGTNVMVACSPSLTSQGA